MIREVLTIDAEESVAEACRIMGEKHVGSLIVTTQDKPLGIFTERDLLSKIILKRLKLEEIKVKEYMSEPLTVINPDFHLKEVARIMTRLKISRLPVIEDEKLVGIVTSSELIHVMARDPLELIGG